jgi:hypothetical protein
MTWIGKILSVFVLILGIAVMWFITTVFVARTNWKNDRDAWQTVYREAEKARVAEQNSYRSEKDALERQIVAARTENKGLADQIASLKGQNDKVIVEVARLNKVIKDSDVTAAELQALLQALTDEVNKTRVRNVDLEKERVALVTAKENAEKDRQTALNTAKQATNDKQIADAKVESLTTQVAELQASGGDNQKYLLSKFGKLPAPLPDNIRGTVTAYKDGYLSISIGIDAGLTNGASLDIFRTEGGGQYLGTITIERVYPKEAVASFKPSRNIALSKLRPEELPKVGDTVGKAGVSGPISLK